MIGTHNSITNVTIRRYVEDYNARLSLVMPLQTSIQTLYMNMMIMNCMNVRECSISVSVSFSLTRCIYDYMSSKKNNNTGMDTDGDLTDQLGNSCEDYNVSMCGQYDDDEYEYEYNWKIQNFQSGRMCCVCGGGNGAIKSTKEKPASGVFAIGFEQDLLLSGNFDTKTLNLPDLEDLATTLENIADNDAASSRNVLFQNRGILMTANKVRHFCISFFFTTHNQQKYS